MNRAETRTCTPTPQRQTRSMTVQSQENDRRQSEEDDNAHGHQYHRELSSTIPCSDLEALGREYRTDTKTNNIGSPLTSLSSESSDDEFGEPYSNTSMATSIR